MKLTYLKKNTKDNNFLQLLNKDGNWVKFFIQTIVQDSAKKGYEKVLFPTGETAAKVEGHETIADELKNINSQILDIKSKSEYKVGKNKGIGFTIYDKSDKRVGSLYDTEKQANEALSSLVQGNKSKLLDLEQRKSELKSQGIEKFKPIEGFYEIRVKNILNKVYGKDNIKTITDEYGNKWNEVIINQHRDLNNILLQKK